MRMMQLYVVRYTKDLLNRVAQAVRGFVNLSLFCFGFRTLGFGECRSFEVQSIGVS